ncbi:TIGR03619 family F420-dependent LLM class oxidoreductase [Streptomyces sp. NPDC059215]|uniref:TIGR03619 family F420-dependent LLM class oxidoreductase n=1 Tax=Streptomyces sp. NPDC059215 TaxID=3346772 RepID=UPI0036C7686D
MRIGFALPQFGIFADPTLVGEFSVLLENLGYDSLWVGDRILGPLNPSDPYPVPTSNGVIPPEFGTHLDPILTLTVAALSTQRVRLGTSTLNALYMPPVLLARSLTTLDLISHGRLQVGLGLGWMRDEYAAVNVPWTGRGARLDETLNVLQSIWTSDIVQFEGEICKIPPSNIFPKPVQKPHPPIYLAGFAPAALERVGRRADGWLGIAMPIADLSSLLESAREATERAGRDPSALEATLRINPEITNSPGMSFARDSIGTVEQVCEYINAAYAVGVTEAFVDVQTTARSMDEMSDTAEAIIAGLRTG